MAREEPKRSCLGCRVVKGKEEMLRYVLSPDRVLVPDLSNKLPGRGAYTCLKRSCLEAAVAGRQFARSFKGPVETGPAESLSGKVMELMEERIASYLALANKAGRIVAGSDMVIQALRRERKERVILLATDISEEIGRKVSELADRSGTAHFMLLDKERVGALLGKGLRSVVAVEGQGFVTSIIKEIERYRNFMGEGA